MAVNFHQHASWGMSSWDLKMSFKIHFFFFQNINLWSWIELSGKIFESLVYRDYIHVLNPGCRCRVYTCPKLYAHVHTCACLHVKDEGLKARWACFTFQVKSVAAYTHGLVTYDLWACFLILKIGIIVLTSMALLWRLPMTCLKLTKHRRHSINDVVVSITISCYELLGKRYQV